MKTSGDALLRTQQVARALGVSQSTIKRWVDLGTLPAARTVGKHRLLPVAAVVRFARERRLPHDGLEQMLGPPTTPIETVEDATIPDRLLVALREGRGEEARTLIHAFRARERSAVVLADEVIRPVMKQIGHGWMVGSLEIFQEHEATRFVASTLSELIGRERQTGEPDAPLALGAAPEGDPYVLPGLLGELVLRERGWRVRNLGSNLPLSSLANAVRECRPRLVFLSVTYLADETRFLREYPFFFKTARKAGTAVILGGQALVTEIRSRLLFASFGDRMAHLDEFAQQFRRVAEDGSIGDSHE